MKVLLFAVKTGIHLQQSIDLPQHISGSRSPFIVLEGLDCPGVVADGMAVRMVVKDNSASIAGQHLASHLLCQIGIIIVAFMAWVAVLEIPRA